MQMVEMASIHISSLYTIRQLIHGQSYRISQIRTHSHGQREMPVTDISMSMLRTAQERQ